MANREQDLTMPLIPDAIRPARGPVPAAAYVPIAVALIGITFILVGGIRARDTGYQSLLAAAPAAVDTVVTGSVPVARDLQHDMEFLDR